MTSCHPYARRGVRSMESNHSLLVPVKSTQRSMISYYYWQVTPPFLLISAHGSFLLTRFLFVLFSILIKVRPGINCLYFPLRHRPSVHFTLSSFFLV